MEEEEALVFENNLHFDLIIRMRRWDEAAKMVDYKTPDLDHYLNIIENYLENN